MSNRITRKGFLWTLVSLLVFGFKQHTSAERREEAVRIPEPKRYLLNHFHVAGLRYYHGAALVADGGVKPGDALRLAAQPQNPHDKFAVEIYHAASGTKLGYAPHTENSHLSRLLMQGAALEAQAVQVTPEAKTWEAVAVEVWLAGQAFRQQGWRASHVRQRGDS